jgi:sulfide:quinone oxidoreductase
MPPSREMRTILGMDGPKFSVLVAGGGVAALEAALTLNEVGEGLVEVELLAPEPVFWYRPVAVAEPFGLGVVRHFDLGAMAERAGAGMRLGALAAVDVEGRIARTKDGTAIPYDALLIACGAVPIDAVPGALTFRGPADGERFGGLLRELEDGMVSRIAFVVPWGAAWPLPAYELALMTARRAIALDREIEVSVVTPEAEPLHLFGRTASNAVSDLLAEAGIEFVGSAEALELGEGRLVLSGGEVPADRAVALPRLQGARIDGIAQTSEGFIPVDEHCEALGAERVFAAGDITSFPIKQGGIAAQQAVVAAEAIAVLAGATLVPCPFRPVLRGLLLTGGEPRYLRRDLALGDSEWASAAPIWWPPTKIVGRRLTPFLASIAGEPEPDVPDVAMVDVNIELDRAEAYRLAVTAASAEDVEPAATGSGSVGRVMRPPITVGSDTTLDAVAQAMREHDRGSVLVVDDGELIGILTARDVLRAVAGGVSAADAHARSWMTAAPITVAPHTPLGVAADTMIAHGIHHLPVVEDEEVVGMVGLRDVTPSRGGPTRLPVGLGF